MYSQGSWLTQEWFVMYICLTHVLFTFSYRLQILPSYLFFINIMFTVSSPLKGWCLGFPVWDFCFPLPYLPFIIECTLCWETKLHSLLGLPFPSRAAKGKEQTSVQNYLSSVFLMIYEEWQSWSLQLCTETLWWKYVLSGTVSLKWFHRRCSPSPLYQRANRELYVPVPSILFCVCKTWKCLCFYLF